MSNPLAPNWEKTRAKIRSQAWALNNLEAIRGDYVWWQPRLEIPGPERETRRFHGYYCDVDGAKLRFDTARPREHACPACGKIHTGAVYDGAWCAQMHNAASSQIERAVLLLHLGDAAESAEARATLLGLFGYYVATYPDYALHGDPANAQGRVMGQLDVALTALERTAGDYAGIDGCRHGNAGAARG
jgi:hypothetical protein